MMSMNNKKIQLFNDCLVDFNPLECIGNKRFDTARKSKRFSWLQFAGRLAKVKRNILQILLLFSYKEERAKKKVANIDWFDELQRNESLWTSLISPFLLIWMCFQVELIKMIYCFVTKPITILWLIQLKLTR